MRVILFPSSSAHHLYSNDDPVIAMPRRKPNMYALLLYLFSNVGLGS